MLQLKGVHAHYGLSHVLQGVDLTVGKGEVVGLFGRNGVGKTTVLRTIAGWLTASQGEILFNGVRIDALRADLIARRGIALVPEDRRIFPGLTVEENLLLGLMQRPQASRAQTRAALEEIYGRFPRLAERRRQVGVTLSGGEQQMLTIARALVGKPRLMLIDEPSEGLAPMIVDEIFQLLAQLRAEGVSVLLVEQNVVRALKVVDRFYAVERGRIVLEGIGSRPADHERLLAAIAV
jgi:branched-chain amino acid transport system ATP-binding protein